MQIGLLIYGHLDTISGGYLYDRQLVSYLESQGDQVEIVSIPWQDYYHSLLDNFSRDLENRILDLDLDVLLQDELSHPSLFYFNRRIKESLNYPIISIVHHLRHSESHPGLKKLVFSAVENRYLKSVDGYIFNSQNSRQAVQDMVGSDKSWVLAYPSGDRLEPNISPQAIEAKAHQAGSLQILFLGNIIPRKGLHTLLDALEKLIAKDWQLSVVGSLEFDPAYVKNVERTVNDYGFGNRVKFYGSLEEDQLINVMVNSHVLVVPSYHEGFGIAYLEGMGFGLPAVGTMHGGASEIISDGVNGYLVPRENATELSERISGLIDNRNLLARMSLKAWERYLQHPTWEDSMKRIRRFLEDTVNQEGDL